MIGPVFERLSDSPSGEKADFYKVDVDAQEKIAQEVGIQAMPTFILFHKGQAARQLKGANPAALQVSKSPVLESLYAQDAFGPAAGAAVRLYLQWLFRLDRA